MSTLSNIEEKIFAEKTGGIEIDQGKALANVRVLDLLREACLIESFFPVYISKVMELFWYDLEATAMFSTEGYEAYVHYMVLRRYLDIIGYKPIKDEEVVKVREQNKDEVFDDTISELVNFMATEHFASNFFKDLSQETNEPALNHMLIGFSAEEVVHAQFAFDLLKKELDQDETARIKILQSAKRFKHIGEYVFPSVSPAKEDNIKVIQSFNKRIEKLLGQSLSDSLAE